MIKRLLTIFIILFHTVLNAQFGNEWINYSQKYYSFPVYQEGLYKIDYATLNNANIPFTGIQSSAFQIFGRDQEIPLYMVDNGDNSFDPGDYFLFYANKNDGWIDSLIVSNPEYLSNPNFSLINDTIHYFFSWKNTGTGLRFQNQPDQNFANYTPTSFVKKNVSSNYYSGYYEGFFEGQAAGSIYSPGEGYGFGETVANTGQTTTSSFSIPSVNLYTGLDGFQPNFQVRSSTNSGALNLINQPFHHLRITLGASNLVVVDSVYLYYKQIVKNKQLSISDLTNGGTNLDYSVVNDQNTAVDRLGLTYWSLTYPRLTHANNQSTDQFFVSNSSTASKSRIDLTNLSASNPIVFSFGAVPYAQIPVNSGAAWQFIIPNTVANAETEVRVFEVNNAIVPTTFKPVNNNGTFTDFSSMNLDSALVFVYPKVLESSTLDYKNYRSSLSGGGYNVIAAEVNELAFQFGGGVRQHPAGIRRFIDFILNNSTQQPSGLFLIGKGINSLETRFDPNVSAQSLVAPFGYPSSDIAFTTGLTGFAQWAPALGTGRISVSTNAELTSYLNKVIEYDAAQNPNSPNFSEIKDWQKQILHFVGGSNANQQQTFQDYMGLMKNIIEDTLFAGNVTSFNKTSSNPLDPIVVSGVTQKISDGVSIMNFFGHAAASNNGFEINIDEPSNWENQGKYPLVIGNSCYNGNIFGSGTSTSEKFVNLTNEGAIAFLSTVSVGYAQPLFIYTSELYRQFSYKNYGLTLGDQIKNTITSLDYLATASPGVMYYESAFTQMTLHGDPMLRVNYSRGPELDIRTTDLSISPTNINLSVDSIALTFKLRNLGTSIKTPIYIEITRDFPGTSVDSLYSFYIPRLNYDTIITKKFPLQAGIAGGVNQFTVSVDIPSVYVEQYDEQGNNSTSANFFLNIEGIMPIWPYNYAVIPYDTVTVKASTINPIAGLQSYRFEMDTTDTYDSPQLRKFSITELGGVKQVRPDQWLNNSGAPFPVQFTDSTVYFWRVSVDSTVLNWSEFSFQYIPGKRGWGQDHFFQFKNNYFSGIDYNRNARLRQFAANEVHQIGITAFDNYNVFNAWTFDGGLQEYATCSTVPRIYVGVTDSLTLLPWKTHCPNCATPNDEIEHDFGNTNNLGTFGNGCRNRYELYFVFDQADPTSMANFQNMIENGIPNGNYVVIYTPSQTLYHTWDVISPSVYTMFQNLGFPEINNTQEEKPFALFFKKGTVAMNQVKVWPQDTVQVSGSTVLSLTANVFKPDYVGVEATPLIGPSFDWQTIFWRRDSLESPSTDSVRIFIDKYDINTTFISRIDTVFTPNDSILNLNNLVDAAQFPYIKIGIYNYDLQNTTPAQIDRLHVLYSPVPEAAIDGTSGYFLSSTSDTLTEGQSVKFAVDIVNVSEYPMDSLLVDYWIEDNSHVKHVIPYNRQDSLKVHQVIRDTLLINTLGLAGYNVLWMEVNPYINGSLYKTDQLEQYHFNNLLQLPIYVLSDEENPILDVTFNGKHILNGDIIDPESDILITLKDENEYLIMDNVSDTSLFGVYITDPDGVQTRIPFMDAAGNVVMQWIPADAQYKKFKILFPKTFEKNGTYQLIVQGSDRSGNISGDFEYRVNFEVIRESSITYMMNYPNPFSTSTRFVFTLTGTKPPENMVIQIMTVTGRVIREITEDEIGPISIGRNISEYAWDGTDEFGDRLANGVYLYRVKAQINGEDIKHRESGADGYFKQEFGKMYLMR